MRRLLSAALLCWLFGLISVASAADLGLTGQAIVVSDPDINGVYTTGNEYWIGVTNSEIDAQLLGSFGLKIQIVPTGGSTGSLHFQTVAAPSTDYIFASLTTVQSFSKDTNTQFTGFAAVTTSPFGAAVPASGKYLAEFTFMSPNNATGTFNIVATTTEFDNYWADSTGLPLFAFDNVPTGGDPVVLGTVTVVPEPDAALLAIGSFAIFRSLTRRRRS